MTAIAFRARRDTSADYTVPLGWLSDDDYDTLRWPPFLDHDGIVRRLAAIRESAPAYSGDLTELARLFEGVEWMSSAQLAGRVVAAMSWTQDNHGYGFVAAQLQIVALNLKNLR
jgi:hypothetical protein